MTAENLRKDFDLGLAAARAPAGADAGGGAHSPTHSDRHRPQVRQIGLRHPLRGGGTSGRTAGTEPPSGADSVTVRSRGHRRHKSLMNSHANVILAIEMSSQLRT
jgi:hypothetical protein